MGAMDVVVHASEREPFGIVIAEAMALKKMVIATCPGGPEEIIRSGEDGLLVPWNDEVALGKAILRCLETPVLAERLAQQAQKRSQDFTTTRYAERLGVALRTLFASQPSHSFA